MHGKSGAMNKYVMIVDDFAGIRRMVSATLKGAGFEVVEAVDGKDALAKLASTPLQMVITGLNMPKLDGMRLVKRIRANPAYKLIPIIMVTAEARDSKKLEGKAAGVTGWIIKPFKPEQLITVVKKVLG
jgi:two-component system, chemotaxis family, chemotaxis protein CheY